MVRSVMSLFEGAKTRVRVDSELSEELALVEMLSLNLPEMVRYVRYRMLMT